MLSRFEKWEPFLLMLIKRREEALNSGPNPWADVELPWFPLNNSPGVVSTICSFRPLSSGSVNTL